MLVASVGARADGENPGLVRGLEDDRTGPVAEEDAGAPVLVVGDAREHFSAHDERPLGASSDDHRFGKAESVDEARAGRLEAEGHARSGADPLLEEHPHVGKHEIGGGRPDDDEVETAGFEPGGLEGSACRPLAHVEGRLPGGHDVATLDARAFADPGVVCVDEPLEMGVVEDTFGDVAAGSGHPCVAPPRTAHPACTSCGVGLRRSARRAGMS